MILPDDKILDALHRDALAYSVYADAYLEFWHSKSRNDEVHHTCIYYGRENFMHLVGIKSRTCSAYEFYEKCLDCSVTIADCTPTHDVVNRNTRIKLFESLFNFSQAKIYRIGEKDLTTPKNDFDIATGNEQGTIGYANRYKNTKALPTTLTDKPIRFYCSETEKILAVLLRKTQADAGTLIFEITKGILNDLI